MADDADFYIERVNAADSTYWYDNAWHRFTVREEEIQVRGDTAVVVQVRSTPNGPIVTDIRTPLNRAVPPFVASMRWVGAEMDDQIGAFLRIDRAHNWAEFVEGLRSFSVPGQNFVYGDAHGNIGYYCAARLPIRASGNGLLPTNGWERNARWTGFVPFDQLPHMLNPAAGYVASANNKTADDTYPYYIGDLWEPPSRILRLHETLGDTNAQITIQDCIRLQNDTYSPLAKELTSYLLSASADSVIGPEYGELVREYLRNWDFRFDADDIATSIYQEFLVRLMHNIYEDEMGEELFHDFTMLVNVPLRVTTRLLKEGTSFWFDDVRTPVVESRDDIVRRSAREAITNLAARTGKDSRLWRWGDMHEVTLQHPFGLQKPLDKIFSIGPFPYPGASTALMSGEYSITAPFAVSVGASYRQIFSFAGPATHLAVLPSGESGQVYHDHYHDQTQLWLHGAYRTVARNPSERADSHLLLLPTVTRQ
jgi:penicillin amidase